MPFLLEPTSLNHLKPIGSDTSSIDITGQRPSYITGCLLTIIRGFFSNPLNHSNEQLANVKWTADENTCTLKIMPAPVLDFSALRRPLITVAFKGCKTDQIGMNSRTLGGIKPSVYSVRLVGEHLVSIFSNSPTEALTIAEELFFYLTDYHQIIKCDLKLSYFFVNVVSEIKPSPDIKNCWETNLGISWEFVHSWEVHKVGRPIIVDLIQK